MSLGGTGNDRGHGITSVGLDKIAVTGCFVDTATFSDVVLSNNNYDKGSNYDTFIAMVSVCTLLFAMH